MQVIVHNAVDLLIRAAAEWKPNLLQDDALATHETELQSPTATFKANLANPTKE